MMARRAQGDTPRDRSKYRQLTSYRDLVPAPSSHTAPTDAASKTVSTEVGEADLDVPRDRAGTFTPMLVPKGQSRLDGLDACESPSLMRQRNDGARHSAPSDPYARY